MARLRIDTARVCHTHRKVNIPHDLREQDIRDLGNLLRLTGLSVIKCHIFQCRRFNVRRREPVRHRIDRCNQVFLVEDLLQTVLHIRNPAARFQAGNRFGRLNLVAGIAQGFRSLLFLRRFDIQLTEHLPERLDELFFEAVFLILCPYLCTPQQIGMRDGQCVVRFKRDRCAVRGDQFVPAQEAESAVKGEHQPPDDRCGNRVPHQRL